MIVKHPSFHFGDFWVLIFCFVSVLFLRKTKHEKSGFKKKKPHKKHKKQTTTKQPTKLLQTVITCKTDSRLEMIWCFVSFVDVVVVI